MTILREARKQDTVISRVKKERLNQMSVTKNHQGVIAQTAACAYADVEDILRRAEEKGEDPFLFILDNIEDPHNLGAIIRTANLAGAHVVIIQKRRSAGLTAGDEYFPDHREPEKAGTVVCMRRYGRGYHVPGEPDRADRTGDRK